MKTAVKLEYSESENRYISTGEVVYISDNLANKIKELISPSQSKFLDEAIDEYQEIYCKSDKLE